VLVQPEDEIMLITVGGTLVRTSVAEIRIVGRTAMGVKLIRVGEGERLAGVERIQALEGGPEEGSEDGEASEDGGEDPGEVDEALE
jgi:DNA gyrase subunit A